MTDPVPPSPLRVTLEDQTGVPPGETEQLLVAYDDARNRLGFYEREVNRLEGDETACRRAEVALREVDEARAALLASVQRLRQERDEAERETLERAIDAASDDVIAAHLIVVHDRQLGTRALRAEEVRGIMRHILLPGSTLR